MATEDDFRQILSDALTAFKGLRQATVDKVLNAYAPKLSAIASADPADRDEMYEAVTVNLKADLAIVGIKGETAIAAAVMAALKTAAGFARLALA